MARIVELLSEDLIPLSEAAFILPRKARVNRATVYRWTLNGVGGVKLESVRVGSAIFTTKEAVTRFLARTNSITPIEGV